jgi:hypothetical protein
VRQLVIVEDFSSLPAQLLARLERASLPATPVVVYDAAGSVEVLSALPLEPVEALDDLPAEVFAPPGRDGLVIVSAHHGGRFPERLGQRTRSLLAACDTVVARCPRRDAVSASQFYSPFLYALDGQLDPAAVRTATAHLLGRVDRARNEAARRRHDAIDEIPQDTPYVPTGEAARLANTDLDAEPGVEATVFETAYGELSTEMARLGFELAERKVREARAAVSILAGGPGIALYGPYVALEEGDYRYRVEIEGGGRDVAFTLEAAWNAGGQVLAVHRYALPHTGRVFADLVFQVTGPAVGRALELRLWNDDASAQFDVVRLSLVRLAGSW